MKIITIDNDKGFVNSDLKQVQKILKDTEFEVKRSSKTRFSVHYIGNTCMKFPEMVIPQMAGYLHDLISTNFKQKNV